MQAAEKKGREAILYFEQVRSFFTQASPGETVTEFPVRIIAFRSEKEFRPCSPSGAASAYYQPGRDRDYIVMSSLEHANMPAAIHEYMHLVIQPQRNQISAVAERRLGRCLFDTGAAGKTVHRRQSAAGPRAIALPGKMADIRAAGIGERAFVDIQREGPGGDLLFRELGPRATLILSPEYTTKFRDLLLALNRGMSSGEAFQLVYGKPASAVFSDAESCLRRDRLYGAVFDVKLSKSEEEANSEPVSAMELELTMTGLLAGTNKTAEAEAALKRLAGVDPGNPEIPEALGYLAWRKGDRKMALEQFEKTDAEKVQTANLSTWLSSLEHPGAATRTAVNIAPPVPAAPVELPVSAERLARVSGEASNIECTGKGAKLTVLVSQREMVLVMPDPEEINLRHKGDVALDFSCGPQKPFPVTVEYLPFDTPGASVGLLKTLEF